MPSYYTSEKGLELYDVIQSWGLPFGRANIVKYIVRAGRKPGESKLEAITKAATYANLRKRPQLLDAVTPADLQRAFKLDDEQAAALQACLFGTDAEILAAIDAIEVVDVAPEPPVPQAPDFKPPQAPPEAP